MRTKESTIELLNDRVGHHLIRVTKPDPHGRLRRVEVVTPLSKRDRQRLKGYRNEIAASAGGAV